MPAMDDTPAIDERVREAAVGLAGAPVQSIRPATSGANSRIYRVETSAGPFALKSYPMRLNDTRSRAEVEWRTLRFLTDRGVTSVPAPIARDEAGQFMLMEWIDGASITAHQPGDVDEAASFICRVFELSSDAEAAEFPLASEACLSIGSIVEQIEDRLPQLRSELALETFLATRFMPALAGAKGIVQPQLQQNAELEQRLRRLIPADFGFHNVVRQGDGGLRYVDFEYFGWDDPVKLTADFLLHPAMQLSADDNRNFFLRMRAGLSDDADFEKRLMRHLPLFALRWVLILFNPWRRDRLAELSKDERARQALLDDRLSKAQRLLRWTDPEMAAAMLAS